MIIPAEFNPTNPTLSTVEKKYGWYYLKSPKSFIIEPGERRVVPLGYRLHCSTDDFFLAELDPSLNIKGIFLLGHNLNKRLLEPGEEVCLILQNLNPDIRARDPMNVFGSAGRVQISVNQEIIKIKQL